MQHLGRTSCLWWYFGTLTIISRSLSLQPLIRYHCLAKFKQELEDLRTNALLTSSTRAWALRCWILPPSFVKVLGRWSISNTHYVNQKWDFILRTYPSLSTLKEVCYEAASSTHSRRKKKKRDLCQRYAGHMCAHTKHLELISGPQKQKQQKSQQQPTKTLLLSYWSYWNCRNGYKNFWKVFKFIPQKLFQTRSIFVAYSSERHQMWALLKA